MRFGMFPKIFVLLIILTAMTAGQGVGSAEVTLSKCWGFSVADGQRLSARDAHIFVGGSGAKIETLSLDGNKLWTTELGGEIVSNMLAGDGGLLLVTSIIDADSKKLVGGTLRFLSKETGITAWTAKLPEADSFTLGLAGESVVAVTSRGAILAFDGKSGAAKWRRELAEGFVGEPRFNGANVYAASTANQVFTVALATGEIISVKKLKFAPTAIGEITGEVITGDERGNVTSLGKSEKVNWNFKSGGRISTILEVGDNLLAASNDNFVYLFTARNGGVEWKKRLENRASQIAVIDGRFALVSGYEEHGAMLIDINSGKIAGQLNLADNEFAVARPVSSNGKIFILTNNAVHAYSAADCVAEARTK